MDPTPPQSVTGTSGPGPGAFASPPLVSIIIPMLNERDGLSLLFSKIESALSALPVRWEIIVVDDGSTDGTQDVIVAELARFESWKVLILARNFGQQAAYRAGLEEARGAAVVFLDADLQDPPELIGQFIAKWKEGYKVVTATRTSREERGFRRWMFDLFHVVFYRMTDRTMPLNSGTFCLVDRLVVNRLVEAQEVTLFLPALKCWFGYAQAIIPYARQERAVGAPKQSFRKLLSYALNGLFSFSDRPLQWIGLAGLLISLLSFGYAGVLVVVKLAQLAGIFLPLEVKGFTTLAVAIFCLSGIQLLSLGILGQYLARVYREIKRRPIFVVEKILSSDEPGRIRQPR